MLGTCCYTLFSNAQSASNEWPLLGHVESQVNSCLSWAELETQHGCKVFILVLMLSCLVDSINPHLV